MIKIAVDGPGGAGKSSLARAVAREMHIVYVDTGALYRSIGLYMKQTGTDPKDVDAVGARLPEIQLEMTFVDGEQHILLCGEDVGERIRTPEMSMYASAVSAIPAVRAYLLDTQRRIADTQSVIMDGRDIGTVIFPDADVKIFLIASPEARARRRYAELTAKGMDVTYEEVLSDMNRRDAADSGRAIAPAVAAEDAVVLDNSDLDAAQTLQRALEIIEQGLAKGKKKRKTVKKKRTFYMRVHFLSRFVRFLLRLHPTGAENLPEEGGCIVCANHVSLLDVFALGACFPRQLFFLAKAELFRIPLLRTLIVKMGACKVDRGGTDVQAMKRSIAMVQEGDALALFPQGHRYPGVNPAETVVKSGVGFIAYHAKAPVVPVCLKMKKQRYALFRRVEVCVGRPIPYEELGFVNGGRDEYEAATRRVFTEICALGDFHAPQQEGEDTCP